MNSLTPSFFSSSKYNIIGRYRNIYAITAAERVNRDIIITGAIIDPDGSSTLLAKFISSTTSTMYVNADSALYNGFFVMSE